MKKISQENVNQSLAEVVCPEIDYSLVDLGMIKDVVFNENEVSLTLKLPFSEIPIRDYLIKVKKKALADLDQAIEVELAVVEMDPQERDEFMKKAKEGWKL
jgi:ATP-binding protein involved in chromosome partitioning